MSLLAASCSKVEASRLASSAPRSYLLTRLPATARSCPQGNLPSVERFRLLAYQILPPQLSVGNGERGERSPLKHSYPSGAITHRLNRGSLGAVQMEQERTVAAEFKCPRCGSLKVLVPDLSKRDPLIVCAKCGHQYRSSQALRETTQKVGWRRIAELFRVNRPND